MLIAYIAYSTKRATDLQAFDLLTSEFTGILKKLVGELYSRRGM